MNADRARAAAWAILAALAARIEEDELRQRFVEQGHARFPVPTEKQAAKQNAAGLTAKEREVAALIAAGKSNKEIAERLVVSHHTVEFVRLGSHLRHMRILRGHTDTSPAPFR